MEKILTDFGFTRQVTKNGVYFYGYLESSGCLEVKIKDFVDIYYVSAAAKECQLTQFSKDINLEFFKRYMDKLISALG